MGQDNNHIQGEEKIDFGLVPPPPLKTGSPSEPITLEEFKTEAAGVKPGTTVFYLSQLPSEEELKAFRFSLEIVKRFKVSMIPDERTKTITVEVVPN